MITKMKHYYFSYLLNLNSLPWILMEDQYEFLLISSPTSLELKDFNQNLIILGDNYNQNL